MHYGRQSLTNKRSLHEYFVGLMYELPNYMKLFIYKLLEKLRDMRKKTLTQPRTQKHKSTPIQTIAHTNAHACTNANISTLRHLKNLKKLLNQNQIDKLLPVSNII